MHLANHLQIDAVLASSARRTRETAAIVVSRLNLSVAIVHESSLYLATADTLLRAINACHAPTQTLLLVAHNPGVSELAHQLSGGERVSALRTGGLCQLTFRQADWRDLGHRLQCSCCVDRCNSRRNYEWHCSHWPRVLDEIALRSSFEPSSRPVSGHPLNGSEGYWRRASLWRLSACCQPVRSSLPEFLHAALFDRRHWIKCR